MGDVREQEHRRRIRGAGATIVRLLGAVTRGRLAATDLRGAAGLADAQADRLDTQLAAARRELVQLESEPDGDDVGA